MASKEAHENVCKGSKTFIKGLKGHFAADGIAQKHDHEINRVVFAKACACKLHMILDGVQQTDMGQYVGHRGHFSHPRWGRGYRVRGHLDSYRSMRHTGCVSSFLGNSYINLFPYKETHFFGFIQFPSFLAQLGHLVAHHVGSWHTRDEISSIKILEHPL